MNRSRFVRAKDNPFTVQRVTAIPYRFLSGDWQSHLNRLAELNYRAAIVGPQGAGKSTLLRDLSRQLVQRGHQTSYIFLPRDRSLHRRVLDSALPVASDQITLVDGVERLSILNRVGLYLRHTRLVVTVHSRHLFPCRMRTWITAQPCFDSLVYVLAQININDPLLLDDAKRLFVKHDGNIRNVLRDLYDSCATPQRFCDGNLVRE